MSGITTHVLDTSRGLPAEGVPLRLERYVDGAWIVSASGRTDSDGRCPGLLPPGVFAVGDWRLHFDTRTYFSARRVESFYPYVEICFVVKSSDLHYHVPLLLNPFGYTTYRGS